MDRIAVKDIYSYMNSEIDLFLMVIKKELREGKNNNAYLRLDLADKTGPISGNVWQDAHVAIQGYDVGDVVKLRVRVVDYKGQVQLNIKKVRRATDNEFILADFIPKTKKDETALTNDLFAFIDSIKTECLHQLLHTIFDDPQLLPTFLTCPAAKSWHHNYAGGLLEHTVSVTKICDFASKLYPVNRDELLTGALLHDFGKIFEYITVPIIDFSDEGRLLGHIIMSDQMIVKKAGEINLFPPQTLMKLRHLIVAHHGEMENGSPKVPQTIEAIVLHFADNLDAQTTGVLQLIEASNDPKALWTEFDRLNSRYYFIGKKD